MGIIEQFFHVSDTCLQNQFPLAFALCFGGAFLTAVAAIVGRLPLGTTGSLLIMTWAHFGTALPRAAVDIASIEHDLAYKLVAAQNITASLPLCVAYLAFKAHDLITFIRKRQNTARIKNEVKIIAMFVNYCEELST